MANGLFNLKQVVQAVQQGGWPAQKTPAVEYLVVAGGGGANNGGGGAGGLLQGIDPVPNGQTLLVTVGGGGAGAISGGGADGQNSVFGNIAATGGGGGGDQSGATGAVGRNGGSGGGQGFGRVANANYIAGQGIVGQGNAGSLGYSDLTTYTKGGGGGGAGTPSLFAGVNQNGGSGGTGIASSISGTVTAYAGGGGGGPGNSGTGGLGGVGGGGAGVYTGTANSGAPNTGGGAGGSNQSTGGTGGSGIVIVSYPDVYAPATTVNATASTSGSGSISFNGSSYLNYGNQTALHLGNGNFTVEMWLYKNANTAYMTACGDLLTGSGTNTFQIVADATGTKITWYEGSSGGFPLVSTTSLALNTWYHVAFVRNSSTVTLYINGVSEAVATLTTNYNATTSFLVGQTTELLAGRYWNGYISNFRMVKGTAVYTSNFTPSTTPLTAITNTSLLLNAVSGAPFTDGSTNSFAPTNAASVSPAWNQLSPFTGTGYKNRVYTWTTSGTITF